MKVVILAGGFGTRLSEYTEHIPKPMVAIGGIPIIWHIMRHYSDYGYNEFVIALGYKGEKIKEYFLNYKLLNSDYSINLKSGLVKEIKGVGVDWSVQLIDTGIGTLTGTRLARISEHLKDETFLLTYGDGLSDVNIEELVSFHNSHHAPITMTAVRPTARFGELDLRDNRVVSFMEKSQMKQGWINGGFFVFDKEFLLNLDPEVDQMLEREPLESAVQKGELMAFKHEGFWQCMDTRRDHEVLEELWTSGHPPWINKDRK